MKKVLFLIIVLMLVISALSLAFTGCGSSGGPKPDPTPTPVRTPVWSDGGGTGTPYQVQENQGLIALGDIDGDGDPDLILTGSTGSDCVAKIYQNNGSGSFSEIHAGQLTAVTRGAIVMGDLDSDGDPDLILTGMDSTGYIRETLIYQNDGQGSFSEINAGQLTGVYDSAVALGDIDGDGDPDLILTGSDSQNNRTTRIYRNNGHGSFREINPDQLSQVSNATLALGDIDGDSDADLILAGAGSSNVAKIYQNNGQGSFTEINAGQLSAVPYGTVTLGEIDGDGDLDLILTGAWAGNIYQNNGLSSFTEIYPDQLTSVYSSAAVLGDLDDDGDRDLILTGNTGGYSAKIYQNNGSGSFSEIHNGQLTGVSKGAIALGDIDGDGDSDLISVGDTGDGYIAEIYQNNGLGSFAEINSGQLTGVAKY